MSTTMNTNALRLGVTGQSGFRFDNVSVHARALDAAKSTTYAYNTSNQLTSSVTNSTTTTYTYDAWGRLLTRTAGTASASYAYRGDKLKQVTSTFPNEDSVAMNYDGLGRRRNRMANGVAPITWWRYGLGWDTVAEYTDNDTDWAVEGFSKFNVMTDFMHPLAEAAVVSGQPPANAAYSYLALDHLSSTRGVFSQTKTQTGTMEFLPYGARHTATGTLTHHQFTAKPYDTGTGLYNFPYRHYSPAMARWTGADPAGLADGPNVYGYAGDNPVINVDPLGLWLMRCDHNLSRWNRVRCFFRPRYWWDECAGCCHYDWEDCYEHCADDYLEALARCRRNRWCIARAYATLRFCYIRCLIGM